MDKSKLRSFGTELLITFISIFMAFLIGGIIITFLGENPMSAYAALFRGAFGTPVAFTVSLTKAVPLILTGLAVAVAFKCRVFNIGAEGQLLVGALFAAYVGYAFPMPAPIHIFVTLLAGALGGMFWAFIAAYLKHTRNVHVVISTIMLNYIASSLILYIVNGPFKAKGATFGQSPMIADSAKLTLLLQKPMSLNIGFIIAIIMILAIAFLLNKTTTGYEMRAVGINPSASNVAGISVQKNTFLALIISGALAGLAGAIEVTGSVFRIVEGFSPGYGFNGIPVALIAHGNPFGIFFSALLLGAMRNGALTMQIQVGISKNIIDIIQGLVIIFIACEFIIRYLVNKLSKGGRSNA